MLVFVVTIITSIQVKKCNQFSCHSFKTDIFQNEDKMVAHLVILVITVLDKTYHNLVMDNHVLILFLPFESELNSEGYI